MHCFKEGASEEGDESSARSTSSSLGSRPEIARPVGLRGGAPRNRADAKGKVQDDEDLAQKGMPIRGLTNLGNTCFFNSVMQNLLRTRPFRDTMLPHLARKDGDVELEEDEEEEGVEEEGLRGSVAAFFKEMVRSGQITKMRDSVGTVKPSALLAEIIRKEPRYGGGQQHDSHELLWSVLDRLHMEEKKRLKEVAESQAGSRGEVDEHQKGKKEIGPAIVEKTYIQTIFGGNLRGTIACKKCGRESVMYEPFLDLSLPIPERFRGEGGGGFDIGEKKGKKGGKGSAAAPVEEDMSKKQRKELLKQKAKKGGTSADVAEGKPEKLSKHQVKQMHKQKRKESMIAARGKKKKSKGGKESSSEIDEGDGEEDEHGEEEHGLDEDAVEGHDQEGEKKVGQKEGKEDMDIEGADGLKGTDSKGDTGDEMCVAGVEGTKEIEQVCALSEAGFVCGKEDKEDDAGMQRWSQSEKETAGVAEQDSVKDQACRAAEIVSANETVHGPAESSPREDSASYDEDDPDEYLSQKDAEAQRRRIIVPSTVEGPGLEYDEEAPEAYLARKDAQTAHRRSVDVCIEEGINALSLVGEDGKGGGPEDDKRAEDRQGEVLSVRQEGALKGKDADSVIENGEGIGEKEEEAMGLEDDMEDVWKGKQSREGDMSLGMARVLAEEMHICGLKMCFSELLRVELLDGDNMFACEGCGKDALRRKGDKSLPEDGGKPGKVPMVRTPATKQSLLWDAPSILVCNIKRFTMTERGKLRKVDTHVSFPVELDVGAFFHREAPKAIVEGSTYNLYGVVVHSGSLNSGHYIAYVCDSTDGGERVWRYFSDAQVKVVDQSTVLNSQAYILFYERKGASEVKQSRRGKL